MYIFNETAITNLSYIQWDIESCIKKHQYQPTFSPLMYIQKFPRKYIFASSVKRHICHVKSSQFWPWLPISVNDKVFSPFREGLLLLYMTFRLDAGLILFCNDISGGTTNFGTF